jgi:hypothetical protein
MSVKKGRQIDSQDHPAEEHRGRNPKKNANFEVFWAKGGWRSVAKGKERYSALCRATKSVGALITLGQGRQGLKVPELSKNFKNRDLSLTNMLNVTRQGANQLVKLIKEG